MNVTQRILGYPQAQERLLGKTEMPEQTRGVEDHPSPKVAIGKGLLHKDTQQWPALGDHFTLLWAGPWGERILGGSLDKHLGDALA